MNQEIKLKEAAEYIWRLANALRYRCLRLYMPIRMRRTIHLGGDLAIEYDTSELYTSIYMIIGCRKTGFSAEELARLLSIRLGPEDGMDSILRAAEVIKGDIAAAQKIIRDRIRSQKSDMERVIELYDIVKMAYGGDNGTA